MRLIATSAIRASWWELSLLITAALVLSDTILEGALKSWLGLAVIWNGLALPSWNKTLAVPYLYVIDFIMWLSSVCEAILYATVSNGAYT